MERNDKTIKLLLVDDEEEFRKSIRKAMTRRGFAVTDAASGEEGIEAIHRDRPDVVVLDLKMAGLSGIETLQKIREIDENLPVIILTGHGSFEDALAGIRLEIVDFLQKPVDVDDLGDRIRKLLFRGSGPSLRERGIGEIMVSPDSYPNLYIDQPVDDVLRSLRPFFQTSGDPQSREPPRIRSALVYERSGKFAGIIRFKDLLKLVLPAYLGDSPYTTYFTGMFLAQCKLIGKRSLRDLMPELVYVHLDEPLMHAVHLMVEHQLVSLPVFMNGELVGILRERDLVLEIMACTGA